MLKNFDIRNHPEWKKLEARNKELEAVQVRFAGSNLSRLVDAYDEFRAALNDIVAIEEGRNRGEAETATRAREALKCDYTPVFDR